MTELAAVTRRFEIVSTLGPASRGARFIETCAALGQAHFRLNGSHLDVAELEDYLELIERSLRGGRAKVYLDLQGDKRRIGELERPLVLTAGEEVTLTADEEAARTADGRASRRAREAAARTADEQAMRTAGRAVRAIIAVPHVDLLAGARRGDTLVLQDGQARLRVLGGSGSTLRARVTRPAEIRSGCGIHIEGRSLGGDRLPARQVEQVALAARRGVSAVALSYVTQASEVARLRAQCRALGYAPLIIAKLERPEALRRLTSICAAADEVWLCRGDLGALAPLSSLGRLQERAVAAARRAGRPILVAGQVLHHMTTHSEPTRSEVVHLHDLRRAGASGIVLSDETAIGTDPTRVLEVLAALLGLESSAAAPGRQPGRRRSASARVRRQD